MFSMRDKVLELVRQDKSTTKLYRRELVQQEMQRGIYAGLRDGDIRQDLKMLLRQPNVDDDDLLDELRLAEASRRDHELRFEEAMRKSESASNLENNNNSDYNRTKEQPSVNLHLLVDKIYSLLGTMMQHMNARLWAQLNELRGSGINSQVQRNAYTSQQGSSPEIGRASQYRDSRSGAIPAKLPPDQSL